MVYKPPTTDSYLVTYTGRSHSDLNFAPKNEGAGCELIYQFSSENLEKQDILDNLIHLHSTFEGDFFELKEIN